MSLQRRLLLYLLLCAPLVWGVALLASANRARVEVNELFDTELVRLARQLHATLGALEDASARSVPAPVDFGAPNLRLGNAELDDLITAVWNAQGERLLNDREGMALPYLPQANGFVEQTLQSEPWRVYYLPDANGRWLVAAGQNVHERDEVVRNLVGSQLLPWLLVLPVLLLAMAWATRRALAPLRQLAQELQHRNADDLRSLAPAQAPTELQPVLTAVNDLFKRIDDALVRERRFTADAAHELRTPLAVLRAQWDVQRHATTPAERRRAEDQLAAGLDRLERLVSQMLVLARVDAVQRLGSTEKVRWPAVVEAVMSDVLPPAERRRIELACDWPDTGEAFPLHGDPGLLGVLLRNLLDNAVRYAPAGSTVTLRFGTDGLTVANDGPALSPAALARLGERFHRGSGQAESGSGLGVSIAQRVAALHGLQLQHGQGPGAQGVMARLRQADSLAGRPPPAAAPG